jgi:hypothetical protein
MPSLRCFNNLGVLGIVLVGTSNNDTEPISFVAGRGASSFHWSAA